MKTRLTEMLDIEHPIMLAGMGGVSYHELVAAVSEAGGIGTLGAVTINSGGTIAPGNSPGTITVGNTKLSPFRGKAYDVAAEWYFNKGGLISLGLKCGFDGGIVLQAQVMTVLGVHFFLLVASGRVC